MNNYPYYPGDRYSSFKQVLDRLPENFGTRDVFLENDEGSICRTDARQFVQQVQQLGAALLDRELLAGGKVAVIGESSVRWIATYFAVVCGGGVIVPIDSELPEEEIAHIIQSSGAAAVVFSDSFVQVMQQIQGELPDVRLFVQMQGEPKDGCVSYDQLIGQGKQLGVQRYDQVTTDPQKMSSLLYTSGTTGQAKGVMLSQKNILSCEHGECQLIKIEGRGMSVLPIHHSYEFSNSILHAMGRGHTLALNNRPRYFLQNLQLFQPDYMFLVPAYVEMLHKRIWVDAQRQGKKEQLEALIEKSNREREQGQDNRKKYFRPILDSLGGKLRMLISGGAPLAAHYVKDFRDMGILLLQGYGITECSPLVSVCRNKWYKDASIGLPISHNEVQIREEEDGVGEIWVRGDNVMLGYYKQPQQTDKVLQEGWFSTGDVGYLDADGFLYITGRKKNLIVLSNGKNVYPEEIEGYLYKVSCIKEVVVLAEGDGLLAEIVPEPDCLEHRTEQQLKEYLQQEIDRINRDLPVFKQVHTFNIRQSEFEKTTKRSIKRYTI